MKTLDQQIEELKAKHNFQAEMDTLLGQYNPSAVYHPGKDGIGFVSIDLTKWPDSLDVGAQLRNIVEILKPSNDTQVYDHKNKITSYSPFRMEWESGVNDTYVKISYQSGDNGVWIKMPLSFYDKLARKSYRAPNDCEDHYFGGYSRKEMENIRIPVNQCLYYHNLAWYGGNYTTYIVDPEYREQFDNMVLTGELPLG